jgi:predicted regulator of Ras-like GTPase activity (Roadblock/LC7/MglB family)
MADIAALEEILGEIEKIDGVSDVVLVSKSGIHIAGKVPRGAHPDTFTAMCAVLLGSAETATSELKERLSNVVIHLEHSKVMVLNDGPKAIFVLHVRKDADDLRLVAQLGPYTKRVEEFL